MKLYQIIFLLIAMSIYGCNQTNRNSPKPTISLLDTFQKVSKIISNESNLDDYTLATRIEQVDLSRFKLYGKFFNNRVEFYTSNNTSTNVLNSKVRHITLYFIDGVLAKSKYMLAENISTYLINNYGKFKFLPLNWESRDLSKKEPVAIRKTNQFEINSKLKNYQLRWGLENKSILYLNRDSIDHYENKHTYIEMLDHYKDVFKQIEKLESIN